MSWVPEWIEYRYRKQGTSDPWLRHYAISNAGAVALPGAEPGFTYDVEARGGGTFPGRAGAWTAQTLDVATPAEVDPALARPALMTAVNDGTTIHIRWTDGAPAGSIYQLWTATAGTERPSNMTLSGTISAQHYTTLPASGGKTWVQLRRISGSTVGPFSEAVQVHAQTAITVDGAAGPTLSGVFVETFAGRDFRTKWESVTEGNPNLYVERIAFQGAGSAGQILRIDSYLSAAYIDRGVIPYNPALKYRVRVRMRHALRTLKGLNFWPRLGVAALAADGTTWLNKVGSNSLTNQHFVANSQAAGGWDLFNYGANNWVEIVGYFKGHGNAFDNAHDINNPSPLRTGTAFFRPYIGFINSAGLAFFLEAVEFDWIEIRQI